jgi:hypothetical protein
MLANTAVYRATGSRLPGFLGDTLCQTPHRLAKYVREAGLVMEASAMIEAAMGVPRFLCIRARKRAIA